MVRLQWREIPVAIEKQTKERIQMISEFDVIFEEKDGNRYPIKQIQFGDLVFKFYREARNVVLKEI